MYNATKYLRLSYTSDRANESDSIYRHLLSRKEGSVYCRKR